MNIISDAVGQPREKSFIGLVIFSFKNKGIWQYLNTGNILINLILLILSILPNHDTSVFTVVGLVASIIAFTMNVVACIDLYYKKLTHQIGGSISD